MNIFPEDFEKLIPSIHEVSDFIHDHPELGLEEFQASAKLKEILRSNGFSIEDKSGGVETAFKASWQTPGGEKAPCFAFMGEFDALPGLGHACGHNLISAAALAAVFCAKIELGKRGVPARICFVGTPAEEIKGGKVSMIEGGAFKGIDASLIAHPFHKTISDPGCLSVSRCTVAFHGRASHAAIAPEKGINALDAVAELCCDVREWRNHIGPRERVHGIITRGGDAPNIIPDYTEAFYYVRAANEKALLPLKKHLESLADKAAKSTGCTAEVKWISAYKGMVFNEPLNDAFIRVWRERGVEIPRMTGTEGKGSTDAGDVSYIMPCAHFYFGITGGENYAPHTVEFRDAARTSEAFGKAMEAGSAMAEICVRYFTEPDFRKAVHEAFDRAEK